MQHPVSTVVVTAVSFLPKDIEGYGEKEALFQTDTDTTPALEDPPLVHVRGHLPPALLALYTEILASGVPILLRRRTVFP